MEKSIKKHKRKQITLADHFTTGRLLRFVLPSIVMMVFISIYGVVDGLFVSNVVGKTAFASINLIMPFLMVFGGIGFMIGTGGSAIVARTLGEGDRERANRIFSMLIYVTVIVGVIFSAIGIAFLEPIARLLGADDAMMPHCLSYGRWNLIALTAFMLQNVFQSFLVTAEKPKMGLAVTVAAGCTNMVLDYLFVAVFRWGVAGAAVATGLSQCVGGVIPLVYFLLPQGKINTSCLKLTRAGIDWTRPFLHGDERFVRADEQHLVVGRQYALQQAAPPFRGRERRRGIRRHHVHKLHLHRDFHRLRDRLRADNRL